MNNNSNRNNNRRRGRGNRNQGGGGGQQQNRIDSRARGNAPQLLDKYKKLAQDAQHNGDRVQAEYYLQFADHYFRVIADNKARQDESRGRRDDRDERDDYDDESGDYGSDDGMEQRSDQGGDARRRDNNPRRQRPRRDDYEAMDRGAEGDEFTADENPFTRDDRPARAERPARTERPARSERPAREERPAGEDRAERRPRRRAGGRDDAAAPDAQPAALDVAVLPPSISSAASPSGDDEAPKPRLKPRRRKPAGEAEAAVETVDS